MFRCKEVVIVEDAWDVIGKLLTPSHSAKIVKLTDTDRCDTDLTIKLSPPFNPIDPPSIR